LSKNTVLSKEQSFYCTVLLLSNEVIRTCYRVEVQYCSHSHSLHDYSTCLYGW